MLHVTNNSTFSLCTWIVSSHSTKGLCERSSLTLGAPVPHLFFRLPHLCAMCYSVISGAHILLQAKHKIQLLCVFRLRKWMEFLLFEQIIFDE